ncbi:enhanced serine sensitivity protein SseB [Streptomyces sp. XM4193]|uniref:enhanced serine sensitivity protein SseB n=1 Tax=Streptomyces sp. XM4193 TaxID=2929782 RepID=UPI001FF979C3|nr:enhanced serine sensitivity protein SseB [Streptomyces sp. XM4193]MCK1797621.1 enhanced serine sensitivity protein SseB [Streptomyces sp. XM4193]
MTASPQPAQPQQPHPVGPGHGGGWPGNELEETLAAALGSAHAGGRLLEVLGRSSFWVPLPEGGGPESENLDLPTVELDGNPYVPVYSSLQQFQACVRMDMPCAVVPAREFARGLPPRLGVAVNPEGAVGVPLPPEAVAELCKEGGGDVLTGARGGARVRLFEPDWQDDPVDFLSAAGREFAGVSQVRTARRGLASVEGEAPALFVGVELDHLEPGVRQQTHDALARALNLHPVNWTVQLVLLDAAHDPVVDWMRQCVRPFYIRAD